MPFPNNNPQIEIHNLSVRYCTTPETKALENITLAIAANESVGLLGPNGCGKTTLALVISGLLDSSKAQISGEVDISTHLGVQPMQNVVVTSGLRITYVSQNSSEAMSDVWKIGDHFKFLSQARARVNTQVGYITASHRILSDIGFDDPMQIMNCYPFELSGGMAKLVHLSLAVFSQPDILILDEPAWGVDLIAQNLIADALFSIRYKHINTLIVIGHDYQAIEHLIDRVIFMNNGCIIEDVSADNIPEVLKHSLAIELYESSRSLDI